MRCADGMTCRSLSNSRRNGESKKESHPIFRSDSFLVACGVVRLCSILYLTATARPVVLRALAFNSSLSSTS